MCCPKKKILNEQKKKHNPPPFQVKWSVPKLISNFSFAIFFKLLTLFLSFLYLEISKFLWFFNITLRSRSLIRISFRIWLVHHGLSLYLTVTVLVGIHKYLANSRNGLVNWLHMSSKSSNWQRNVLQSTISSVSINFCLSTLSHSQTSCLNEPAALFGHRKKATEASWSLISDGIFKTSVYI